MDAVHSLTLSKDGQTSPGIILLLRLTPATGTRKEPASCRLPRGVPSTGEPTCIQEGGEHGSLQPAWWRTECGNHSRIRSGRRAGSEKCPSVGRRGGGGPYSETDAWRVHRTFKKLQHPTEEPSRSYSTNQGTQAYGGEHAKVTVGIKHSLRCAYDTTC